MLPNRFELLNALGFEYIIKENMKTDAWMDMYQRLVEYKKKHKTTRVPKRYSLDVKLGNWVIRQRENLRKGKMLSNRLGLLNAIDFVWDGRL